MTGKRHNSTGRSSGAFANRKFREANRPPAGEPFVWLTQRMVESPAYRAMSGGAQMILGRIMVEHMAHGGTRNGALVVTYADFVHFGVRRSSILPFLVEAAALGFIERTQKGARAWGEFEGAPAQYRLTWLPTHDGQPATNSWDKYRDLSAAWAAVRQTRHDVENKRAREKLSRPERGGLHAIPAE